MTQLSDAPSPETPSTEKLRVLPDGGVPSTGNSRRGVSEAQTTHASMQVQEGKTTGQVGKAALAKALGWARTTLDRRLESDAQFPVLKRGVKGGGWKFDLAEVRRYLANGGSSPPAAPRMTPPAPRAVVSPKAPSTAPQTVMRAVHYGEETAKQQKLVTENKLLIEKLKKETGRNAPLASVVIEAATANAAAASALQAGPEELCRRLGLRDDAQPVISEWLREITNVLFNDIDRRIRALYADPDGALQQVLDAAWERGLRPTPAVEPSAEAPAVNGGA